MCSWGKEEEEEEANRISHVARGSFYVGVRIGGWGIPPQGVWGAVLASAQYIAQVGFGVAEGINLMAWLLMLLLLFLP